MKTVLVTGDVLIDHHIYMGKRTTHDSSSGLGSTDRATLGGAGLLYRLLKQVSELRTRQAEEQKQSEKGNIEAIVKSLYEGPGVADDVKQSKDRIREALLNALAERQPVGNLFRVEFGLDVDAKSDLPPYLHSYAIWKPFEEGSRRNESVWRIELPLGYGNLPDQRPEFPKGIRREPEARPQIVVVDDAGLGFRFLPAESEWPSELREEASPVEWVVIKMAGPLGHGDLWDQVHDRFRDRLVLVASINDIRREEAKVSKGLSWEQSALDLIEALHSNPALHQLLECRHLIVSFGPEGALHVDMTEPEERRYRLFFDGRYTEGMFTDTFQGAVFGFTSCLTAGIVTQLAYEDGKGDLGVGIRGGLSAMRKMLSGGHGNVNLGCPDYQWPEIAGEIVNPRESLGRVFLPARHSPQASGPSRWSIIGTHHACVPGASQPLYGLAKGVALAGEKLLRHIPHARFAKLYTVDRDEIESLNIIRALVKDYVEHDRGEKPLSLGVFGPPGSGKSFSIKQIAVDLAGRNARFLEFNLSQFDKPSDLIGAFHQVHDEAIRGGTPFVFWDEFDSKQFEWLQYLLAPMQDGAFQDGQITHPIGKCIFIFAGGTSYDMDNFGPPSLDELDQSEVDFLATNPARLAEVRRAYAQFKLKKGPDFKSRLSGYLNVLGPNPRQKFNFREDRWEKDESDICFPVRRALFLRAMLGHFGEDRLQIDRGLLSAFLEVKRYKHGSRSLEKIVRHLGRPKATGYTRSDLPSNEVLSLHVNATEFLGIIQREQAFAADADKIAPRIHEFFREQSRREGWSMSPNFDKPFDDLAPEAKADNRAAAARIPRVLELIGLFVVPEKSPGVISGQRYAAIRERHEDLLAEAEHDGWMEFRKLNGWKHGAQRDDAQKISPAMVPYDQLTDQDKRKDRNNIAKYPEMLSGSGYAIATKPQQD